MNRILENEIEKLISRTPTEEELNSAIQYLDCCADDLTLTKDVPDLLKEWLGDSMAKCQYCGTWALKSEMVQEYGFWYCDETCQHEGYDMHAEARAEYMASNR